MRWPDCGLTVPMAQIMTFLITAARLSMKSVEVDQGSMQVVMMYFTPVLSDGSS